METLLAHFWDWLILFSLIGLGIYTMFAIRRERSDYRDEATPLTFHGLTLYMPRWWTSTRSEENLLQFERTDTRYDWYARFQKIAGSEPLTEILGTKVEAEDLDYDKDDVVIETDPRVLFRHPSAHGFQVVRVEGKASLRIEERIYLDVFLFRRPGDDFYFLFESRSSVLNGMVEGPFFEECLAEMEVKS